MHIPAVFTKMTLLIFIEKSLRIISEKGLYSESVIYSFNSSIPVGDTEFIDFSAIGL